MNEIDEIFDLLDKWRHFPDYQLERRADIYFAAYLPEFLCSSESPVDIGDKPPLIVPEFPLRNGLIYDGESNQSCKVDYLALSHDRSKAFLIELKTDSASVRGTQIKYLRRAAELEFQKLLEGVQNIVKKTKQKEKYGCLMRFLQEHRLFDQGVRPKLQVLYILPDKNSDLTEQQITFQKIASWLKQNRGNDPVASRFAESLERWERPAGHLPPTVNGTGCGLGT